MKGAPTASGRKGIRTRSVGIKAEAKISHRDAMKIERQQTSERLSGICGFSRRVADAKDSHFITPDTIPNDIGICGDQLAQIGIWHKPTAMREIF